MGSANEVLSAIDAAIDDLGVSRDAMRSGPGVEPDPANLPPVSALLLGVAEPPPERYDENPGAARARWIVAALLGALGPAAGGWSG